MSRSAHALCILACLVALHAGLTAQDAQRVVTLIFPDGQRTLSTASNGDEDMVALDDLASIFGLDVQNDTTAERVTVTHDGQAIIITDGQRLVSVAGQLRSLRAPARRSGSGWQVPLSFLDQALDRIYDDPIDVRPRSRLVVVGDVRVPRISVRYRARGEINQLRFTVVPDTPFTVTEEPGSLFVSFRADVLDVDPLPTPRSDMISGLATDAARSGVRVDLGSAFDSFVVSTETARNGVEIVIDLREAAPVAEETGRAVSIEPKNPAAAVADIAPLPDFTAPPPFRVIAIDPGHGGDDIGTRTSESAEKDITLSVARRLRDAIQRRLGLAVVLTRDADENVGLDERAAIANNNKANAFISLHVNASVRPTAHGAEVFFLGMDEYGAEAREAAARGIQRVPVLGGGTRVIDLVEWEMAQLRHLEGSALFADIVHAELRERIPMSPRDVQEAPFRVLVGANMPAILVEMGFISNPGDLDRLTSDRFQDAVVDALVDGILRFRDETERLHRAASLPVRSNATDASSPLARDE